jgi:flagellar biosynthesis/type III secretory pathway protein FliH
MSFRVVKTRHQVRVPEHATLTAAGVATADDRKTAALQAAAILGAAETEARRIQDEAKAEAQRLREAALAEGLTAGRDEGLRAIREEVNAHLAALLEAIDRVDAILRDVQDLVALARDRAVAEMAREVAARMIEAAFVADPDLFAAHVESVLDELQWERARIRLGPGWREAWEAFAERLSAIRRLGASAIDPALEDRAIVLEGEGLTVLMDMENALTAAVEAVTYGEPVA